MCTKACHSACNNLCCSCTHYRVTVNNVDHTMTVQALKGCTLHTRFQQQMFMTEYFSSGFRRRLVKLCFRKYGTLLRISGGTHWVEVVIGEPSHSENWTIPAVDSLQQQHRLTTHSWYRKLWAKVASNFSPVYHVCCQANFPRDVLERYGLVLPAQVSVLFEQGWLSCIY